MEKNKLVVEESIKKNAWTFKYRYKVNEKDLVINVEADTDEIKEIFYLHRLDKQSNMLKDFVSKELLETLRKYKCNFYIAKNGYYIDMRYCPNVCTPSNDFYEVPINGREITIYRNGDIDREYNSMKYSWLVTRRYWEEEV